MATTTPTEFAGPFVLDESKIETIKAWYVEALGDEDKASTVDDCAFYAGRRDILESILSLLSIEMSAADVSGWDVIEGPIGIDGRSTVKEA